LLLPFTIFTLMFGVGLGLRAEAVAALRHRPWLAARMVLGSCLLVPLAALLLLHLPIAAAMPRGVRLAFLVMALCPSAPLTLRQAGGQGGDRELAAGLQLLAAATAIFTIPLMVEIFQVVLHARGWTFPPALVAAQMLTLQGLPLALGMGVRRLRPRFAARCGEPIERFAFLLLLLLLLVILVRNGPGLATFLGHNAPALGLMALQTLAAMAIGGLLCGPGPSSRITGAVVTSLRNPGLALLFVTLYAEGVAGVKLAIVVYLLLTLLLSALVLGIWRRLRAPGGQRRGEPAP
jgi:predicted Na+-dependent transporter